MAFHGKNPAEYSADGRDARNDGEELLEGDAHDKPVFVLEHLATFTVNKESGIMYPADGMRRLLQLEKTTGIWSQKMQLCLDYPWVLIMDFETGNVIERFPANVIQEPTAFTSTDAMELYNNILVFIVSGGGVSRSEMHIFQSLSVSAIHLVEDLKKLGLGKLTVSERELIQDSYHLTENSNQNKGSFVGLQQEHHQPNSGRRSHMEQTVMRGNIQLSRSANNSHGHGATNAIGGGGETESDLGAANDETSSTSSDKYERDVAVLNHCFDDIEKFIARLQHAAAASRELERRRRNRKTKKKDPGEGLLLLRTRPPHEKEFIDIFAKFKLSFNLLAKLKAHIHDPNAPELVHFLFTPLALIVEAASDTYYESHIPTRVVNPLLTREAINLLINCVTSKETELWRSLGNAWTVPRDQWKDDVGSYHPVFMDGWSPDYLVIDEYDATNPRNKQRLELTTHHGGHRNDEDFNLSERYIMHREHSPKGHPERSGGYTGDFATHSEISVDSIDRIGAVEVDAGGFRIAHKTHTSAVQNITTELQSLQTKETKAGGFQTNNINSNTRHLSTSYADEQKSTTCNANINDDQLLESWLDELQASGAKIVLVTYPRTANNDKELSVVRGEYLEILDDSRKWWKARNIRGQVAHVPHTIVTPYSYGDNDHSNSNQFYNNQDGKATLYPLHNIRDNHEESLKAATTNSEWMHEKQVGKKGEFRYF